MQAPIFLLLLTCWMGTLCDGARVIHQAIGTHDQSDPASYSGSVNRKMQDEFVTLENADYSTKAPTTTSTLQPTSAPTEHLPQPTAAISISLAPTDEITDVPSGSPTRRPTKRPIGRPTRRPTALKASGMERTVPTSAPAAVIVSNIQVTEVCLHLAMPCHAMPCHAMLCLFLSRLTFIWENILLSILLFLHSLLLNFVSIR